VGAHAYQKRKLNFSKRIAKHKDYIHATLPSSKRYGIGKNPSPAPRHPTKKKTTTTREKERRRTVHRKKEKRTVQEKGKNKFIKNLPYPNPKKSEGR
jgi:hypothetical protein